MRGPLFIALLALTFSAQAAPVEGDLAKQLAGLPAGFARPVVRIYPLVDQRGLAAEAQDGVNALVPPEPEAWEEVVRQLKATPNLEVIDPAAVVAELMASPTYQGVIGPANTIAERAYADYREVRLKQAADGLAIAIKTFLELEHDAVDKRAVARALLTRGLALLESGDPTGAGVAFRDALQRDSTLRLRSGFDHPDAFKAFEAERLKLKEEGYPAPPALADLGGSPNEAFVIRARAIPGRLIVQIQSPGGVTFDEQPLTDLPVDDGSRLAGRLIACLPFGRAPRPRGHQRALLADAGFGYFVFTESPVESFGHVGVGASFAWLVAKNLSLDLSLLLANSYRDREEHLRKDVTTLRTSVMPTIYGTWGRFRLFSGLGLEVANIGPVVTTTNANCKFFGESEPSPLCAPEVDVDEVERVLSIGATLSAGLALRLVDEVYLSARAQTSAYFYESASNGLGFPVGGQIGLGYRLF